MIEMTNITALPSGNYRVRIEYRGEILGGTFATADEAVTVRDALKRKIVDGALVPTHAVTALDLGPKFLAARAGNRAVHDDEGRWHRHIATAFWARLALKDVSRKHGLVWLGELQEKLTAYDPKKHGVRAAKPLSWGLRRHCLNLSRRFFAWAMDNEYVSANPFVDLVVEREDGDEDEGFQEEWWLDVAEQTRMLSLWETLPDLTLRERLEKWIAQFALWTGLREGELACLHLVDVHVDGDSPHVMVRYGSWDATKQRYRSPKGRKGEKKKREVPLWGLGLEAAIQWLAVRDEYLAANPKVVAARKARGEKDLGLMFPTERGRRRHKKPPRSWKKIVKAFGVAPRIGRPLWWHLLRHSCASAMVSGMWNYRWLLQDVQAILGHADIRTTQMYAHLVPSAVQASAARAGAAFALAKVIPINARRDGSSAVTTSDDTSRHTGKTGHAREDSNLRPTAPEAVKNSRNTDEIARCDGAVTAIRHVLTRIADGEVLVSAAAAHALGADLDEALAAYVAAVAAAQSGGGE